MTQANGEFDDLYRRHAPAAFRRARRLMGTDADAHEVVHDVFLSLFERPEQYRGESRMSTYVYGAVTHACLNRLRNQRTRTRLQREHAVARVSSASAAASENHVVLRSLLSRMPQAIAEAAVYYYMDEMTQDEIALVLGCSRSHVGDLLERLTDWARTEEAAS